MKKGLNKLYKVLIASFGTLSAITILGSSIAMENVGQINNFLGVQTTKYIPSDTGSTVDTGYYKSKYTNLDDEMAYTRNVCMEAEEEGAVLLKNDKNALPLAKSSKVSLFGITTADPVYGGTGSGAVKTDDAETAKEALTNVGLDVNSSLWDWYVNNLSAYKRTIIAGEHSWDAIKGISPNGAPWNEVKSANGTTFSTYGDAAIVMLGRIGGEGSDMPAGNGNTPVESDGNESGDYLEITTKEKALLVGLKAEKDAGTIKKIVVLLNSANPIETTFIDNADYGIDAAMWIGSVGHKGLTGMAHLLVNDVAPSGGLSDTYFTENQQYNPVMQNFGDYTFEGAEALGLGRNLSSFGKYVVYKEGIYLGYKYAETRYEDTVLDRSNTGSFSYSDAIDYPFGFGLTYANFSLTDYNVTRDGDDYTLSVKVTNIDKTFSGKKNVQFYLQKPYTDYDIANGIEKPSVELIDFAKTETLAPGESQTISTTISGREFASYDSNKAKTYILDAGRYYLTAASNSHDAINNILSSKGYSIGDGMTANGDSSLVKYFDESFSDTKYSYTEDTDVKITNQFEEADPNKTGYGDVKFMSRNNWTGTYPSTQESITLTQAMYDKMLALMNITADKTTAYPTYGASNGMQLIDLKGAGYDNEQWDKLLDQLSWEDTLQIVSQGFRSTIAIESVGKVATIDSNGPCGVTDAYGNGPLGLASKNGSDLEKSKYPTCFPCNGIIAASFSKDVASKVGDAIGEDALWAGYSGLYGPCSNIHRSPYEGRAFEYFSEDATLSGKILSPEVKQISSHGCYVYNKHFALNEQETNRGGIATWANEQTIRETYLKAFAIPLSETKDQCVMTSFTRFGLIPCIEYSNLNENFLRNELGCIGINVTDYFGGATTYSNFAACLMNGVNLPDGNLSADQLAVFDAYKAGAGYGDLAQNMRESAHRILYMVANSSAMNGIAPGGKIVTIIPVWQIVLATCKWTFISITGLSLILGGLNLLNIFPKVKQD